MQEVVHVGDIHSGSEPCTHAYDQSIYDENLALIRQIFFASPGQTLGRHPMPSSRRRRPTTNNPTDAQYVENVMWQQGRTVFVTLNIPGGSNNDIDPWYAATHKTPWNPDQQTEMEQRTGADIRWLNAAFAQAEKVNANDVVIVGQADMWDTTDSPSHQTNYESIVAAMAENASFFEKPVLYLNGDSHIFRSDDPLQQGSACFTEGGACSASDDAWNQHPFYNVPNFHRIVVHGSTFPLEWLKLTIDQRPMRDLTPTATSWGPFSWQREIQSQLAP